ncbi:DUF805 domain-containing protein [Rhizobium ruizarguesonis]|uniref:DUF805 domain-containing protein n=1 Tax=Rhizobium ruizarguesonis TaxID=2081791 RepID=UPI00102FA783|nr:DUF805 domain-containing protein [Rhizobium ruizarguesonis]TBA21991.1 DUF805 domain-containing protein [Rhizobium ruizarguesonis]
MLDVLFSFRGRVARLQYFCTSTCIGLVFGAVLAAVLLVMRQQGTKDFFTVLIALGILCGPPLLWVSYSLQAARIRDMGFKPKPILLGVISLNIFVFFVALLFSGSAAVSAFSTIAKIANFTLNASLLFCPSDYRFTWTSPDTDEPQRREPPVAPRHRVTTTDVPRPQGNGARTAFGRRGMEGQ